MWLSLIAASTATLFKNALKSMEAEHEVATQPTNEKLMRFNQ
jgi:hypothetical protein